MRTSVYLTIKCYFFYLLCRSVLHIHFIYTRMGSRYVHIVFVFLLCVIVYFYHKHVLKRDEITNTFFLCTDE